MCKCIWVGSDAHTHLGTLSVLLAADTIRTTALLARACTHLMHSHITGPYLEAHSRERDRERDQAIQLPQWTLVLSVCFSNYNHFLQEAAGTEFKQFCVHI